MLNAMRPANAEAAAPAKYTAFHCRPWRVSIGLVSLFILIVSFSTAAPFQSTLQRFEFVEYHMGIDARMVVYASDKSTAERACAAAYSRIAQLEDVMSDYRPSSELMRLCASAHARPIKVSRDLFQVLRRSLQVSRESGGAFDVTVGPLVALWRSARKTGRLPERAEIETALQRTGWQKIVLDDRNRTVRLLSEGMRLDLGGIGKGYAADCAQQELKRNGVVSALVQLGGDIVVSAPPPGKDGWSVRVLNAGGDGRHQQMALKNCAISTSGDTEQFVVIEGKRYSHIVDPRTGWALTNRVQVSLIAPNGFTSDPLTKALCILSGAEGDRLLSRYKDVQAFRRVLHLEQETTPPPPI